MELKPPLPLGSKFAGGKIIGIRSECNGHIFERYYFVEYKDGIIGYIPETTLVCKNND